MLFGAGGNPLLISPERLAEQGWLDRSALSGVPQFPESQIDFARVIRWKTALLESAARVFLRSASPGDQASFQSFCDLNRDWLEDFALFMVLKQHHGYQVWSQWEPEIRWRDRAALAAWRGKTGRADCDSEISAVRCFSANGRSFATYARAHGVRLMGDLPIYVAHDSVDVWVESAIFRAGFRTAIPR